MNARSCRFERDVLDLVAINQWPQRADASLRDHVAQCALCREVASIATAVREWHEAEPMPRMPEASVVWHRAQVKARAEAARAAARPVWVAQGLACAALIVALVWMGPSAAWYSGLWQGVVQAMPAVPSGVSQMTSPAQTSTDGLMAGWGSSVLLAAAGLIGLVSLVLGALKVSERSEISNHQ